MKRKSLDRLWDLIFCLATSDKSSIGLVKLSTARRRPVAGSAGHGTLAEIQPALETVMAFDSMNARAELVDTWRRSVTVMHIAHHISASRCAKWHHRLGGTAIILATIVGASIFAKLSDIAADAGPVAVIGLGLASMLSAGLTGAVTFLDLDQRARRHLEAAADFQRLRREMEEELVIPTPERIESKSRPVAKYRGRFPRWHQGSVDFRPIAL
jgi:hypothetical protein